ncbi:hypothetical protein [Mesobacillus sp. S13]|uniref:hypothetical protein n=1 Tax=Mesobacillus sp. S13 TaxID=2880221 RepID=UPI001CF49884|nr:hypothetical protein [Mesobacillus sp. S13]
MEAAEILSEPEATSDKTRESSRNFVRTRGNFGQNQRKQPEFCPNPMQLRTKPEEAAGILSEPKATSDKTHGSSRNFVQTRGNFGQNQRKQPEFCPNPMQLRTKPMEAAGILSEPEATSDKTGGSSWDFV